MKPQPCFDPPRHLEEAAELAERRKREAIARLCGKLGIRNRNRFEQAVCDLIDADRRALQERGK